MKTIFRVDASLQIGIGHVMRCLTLAQVLKKNGANVEFICRKSHGNLIDKIRSSEFVVHEIEVYEDAEVDARLAHSHWLEATQEQDGDDCINILKNENINWLIVDHYALDIDWHKRLRPFVDKIMVIDDLADREFDCNMLLNQNLGTKREDYKYKVPHNCKFLLSVKYALLRPEFSNLRERALIKRNNTKEIKKILISMGGSDIKNITCEILQNLNSDFKIDVVLGEKSPYNKIINNYAYGRKNINIIINADNMAQLMLDADLAIGAGGSTSWERCCLGLPTLLYITADNQKKIAKNLEAMEAIKIVKNLKNDLQLILDNFNLWEAMSKNSQNICDGLGAERIKI